MSELPDHDVARDAKLTAVYRAAAQDAPPPALDAAILAAARRAVGARPRPAGFSFARAWRGPLSVAAVVVVSVSLVILMREEAPDLVAPRADMPAAETKLGSSLDADPNAAPRERGALKEEQAPKGLGLKPSHSMPQSGLGMRPPEFRERAPHSAKDALADHAEADAHQPFASAKRRDTFADPVDTRKKNEATAPAPQRQAAKTDAAREFVQAPPAPAAAPPRAPESPRVAQPAAEPAAPATASILGKLTENQASNKAAATSVDRSEAENRERGQARDAPARPAAGAAVAEAKPALPPRAVAAPAPAADKLERSVDLAPEKWLERIEELRKQGRLDEAKASLAEFKKRYPGFRLPDVLRDELK